MFPRDALNRTLWKDGRESFERLEVHYVSRGRPGNRAVLRGRDILDITPGGLQLAEAFIPHHRIFLILGCDGEVLYDRQAERTVLSGGQEDACGPARNDGA